MGYSITIAVRRRELGQRMIDFARKHVRSFDCHDMEIGPCWAEKIEGDERSGLPYCERKGHIGFNYGSDREWKYVLLRWMAIKVGRKGPKTGQYRILYDDKEWFYIDPSKYDELGLPYKPERFSDTTELEKQAMRDEMIRLDDLWNRDEADGL